MSDAGSIASVSGSRAVRAWEVLCASLRLGLASFGGPIAHLGYFERAYVRERRWLTGEEYSGLVALCQILPGPASSQIGFLIGLHRAGWWGAMAAWVGFTLPSALLLFAYALFAGHAQGQLAQAGIHGLKLVAVAVVAQALWSMAKRLCPDRITTGLAVISAALLLMTGGASMQLIALALGATGGVLLCRRPQAPTGVPAIRVSSSVAWTALALFLALLVGLPVIAGQSPGGMTELANISYRAGALVFGGGHVVLPLLHESFVPTAWLSDDVFLAGYGLAQAVPGPLFTFAAYLGAANTHTASPILGAGVALFFIFLPGLLIAVAGVCLWDRFARHPNARAALAGINAVVVGILGAALYDPVWTAAVHSGTDVAIAAAGLILLERWKAPPIAIVAMCVIASVAASHLL